MSSITTAEVLESATAAAAVARLHADESEAGRQLAPPVVESLRDAGLFRLCVPAALGGLEVDPATLVDAIAVVAAGDGAAGWCLMIGATSGVVGAWLDGGAAREVDGDPATITGGVLAPLGTVEVVDGGVRLSGRWPWGSGSQHCDWLMVGCIVGDGFRLAFLPADEVEIVDTWWSAGLRGTGSHDLVITDRFVPTERLAAVLDPPQAATPLYAFPVFGLLAAGIAAVADLLGIGRTAVDELGSIAGSKVPSMTARRLGDRSGVQATLARAEALLRGGRAFLDVAIGAAWDRALVGGGVPQDERAVLRLAATSATRWAADAVDLVHEAAGGTSVLEHAGPIARCFRDIHTVTQHMLVASPTYEPIGRAFLGRAEPML